MLDHFMLPVSNYEASKAWYSAALKPLGARVLKEVRASGGQGRRGAGARRCRSRAHLAAVLIVS